MATMRLTSSIGSVGSGTITRRQVNHFSALGPSSKRKPQTVSAASRRATWSLRAELRTNVNAKVSELASGPTGQYSSRSGSDRQCETTLTELEETVEGLAARKALWAASSFAERRELALQMVPLLHEELEVVSSAGAEHKGSYETKLGEEMLYWVIGTNFMLDAAETLRKLSNGESPASRLKTLGPQASEGIIDVFPMTWFDHFLPMPGSRGQIYLKTGETTPVSGKAALERHGGAGELCAILGAGNVSSINVSDVVNKVLLEGCVAALKLNPVNEYIGPSIERVLQPLIARGCLSVIYGGNAVGKALIESKLVDSVHMTGSDKTYDAIVWQGRPKTGEPPLQKKMTAELGCITPVVIVPGEWSEKDLEFKAAEICSNVAANASCTCIANKLIVTSASWPQRERFLQKLRDAFRSLENRTLYYPGSAEKLAAFRTAYPGAEIIHQGESVPEGRSPFVLNAGLDPEREEFAFREEPWATVLSEVPLKADSVPEFLGAVAEFCNARVWGTLSCQVLIHPRQERGFQAALKKFLRDMRYGTIAVNMPTGLVFTMPAASWGPFPGHTPADIQSGVGVVRNSLLIENVEKTVAWGSWGSTATARLVNFETLCRGLSQFYGDITKDGQPKLLNLFRFIFGVLTGWFLRAKRVVQDSSSSSKGNGGDAPASAA